MHKMVGLGVKDGKNEDSTKEGRKTESENRS